MRNFVDVLIEECKKKITCTTGKECNRETAWKELDRIFTKAQINRQNKNKILSGYNGNPNYRISRGFAIALGAAFGFQIEEMNAFLSKAGYFLSDFHKEDRVIINLMSRRRHCTVNELNEALEEQGLTLLTYRTKKV